MTGVNLAFHDEIAALCALAVLPGMPSATGGAWKDGQ